ncbi:MAG: hypothetical protein KW793_02525 [Candidatus Doudnabacteria bacterium]|nr:hypothetical protein [Candidatus Doudnabacteria bacterium]
MEKTRGACGARKTKEATSLVDAEHRACGMLPGSPAIAGRYAWVYTAVQHILTKAAESVAAQIVTLRGER